MRKHILSLCLLLVAVGAFPQSKLMGAGKATKVGVSADTNNKTVKTKKVYTSKSSSKPLAKGDLFKITDIHFSNVDHTGTVIDDYDSKLYAGELKFLRAELVYDGLASSDHDVEVFFKIYNEDGELNKSDTSPDGFTWKKTIDIKPGKGNTVQLPGWGSNSNKSYKPGLYTYEVWAKGKCMIRKQFRAYTGTKPLSSSSLLSITSVKLTNEDKNGEVLSDGLYDGEIKYISQTVSYKGLSSPEQKAKIYYRLFNAEGNLVSASNSPKGFSHTQEVTIKPGYNTMKIIGLGRSTTDLYTEGENIIEYWIDGEKIYETTFNVVKKGSASSSSNNKSSSGNYELIRNLIVNPFDISTCNVFTSPHSDFLQKFRSKYIVKEDESHSGYYHASRLANTYRFDNMNYSGMQMDFISCSLGDNYTRIVYKWKAVTSERPDKFAALNTLVADLNKIGIHISYEKKDETYDIAEGKIVFAGKEYTVKLSDYGSAYWLSLTVDTRI